MPSWEEFKALFSGGNTAETATTTPTPAPQAASEPVQSTVTPEPTPEAANTPTSALTEEQKAELAKMIAEATKPTEPRKPASAPPEGANRPVKKATDYKGRPFNLSEHAGEFERLVMSSSVDELNKMWNEKDSKLQKMLAEQVF